MINSINSLRLKNEEYYNFFSLKRINSLFDNRIQLSLRMVSELTLNGESEKETAIIVRARAVLKEIQISYFNILILRVTNFIINIFNIRFSEIDQLIEKRELSQRLIEDYSQILSPEHIKYDFINDQQYQGFISNGIRKITAYKLSRLKYLLIQFKENLNRDSLNSSFQSLPFCLKTAIKNLIQIRHKVDISNNIYFIIEDKEIFNQLIDALDQQIKNYWNCPIDCQNNSTERVQSSLDKLFNCQKIDFELSIFDTSIQITEELAQSILNEPISVTMVGVEYASLVKQGGLAEAIEGLCCALKEQHPENQIKLIFPKYSHLSNEVKQKMGEPSVYQTSDGEEYKVYIQKLEERITGYFIEHPSFNFEKDNFNIYQGKGALFADFSKFAADLIYKQRKDTQIIHLHDWHVSGIARKLKQEHLDEWEKGEIPPILFTYHNNGRACQGRLTGGPYTYDSTIEAFRKNGIITEEDNLFVSTLEIADGITTVSKTFAIESQEVKKGEGISFAIRQAAKLGKLTGIINGSNSNRWNPETDKILIRWKDIETQEIIPLNYGSDHADILGQKYKCKMQLDKWVKKYGGECKKPPGKGINIDKPWITYIGRFDFYQKGIAFFEEAVESIIKNGGQFICMGSQETADATKLLDRLQKKYQNNEGILFFRDYQDKNRFFYQEGNEERPGIGTLVRAATDFVFIPSNFEPCGLVQFEGWLFGSLAIGTKTGGLADTIREDKNGFLFEKEKKHSLSQAIEKGLHFWQAKGKKEKNNLIKQLMEEGKKWGWSTTPSKGFSPVDQYRFAYAEAASRIPERKQRSYIELKALGRQIGVTGPITLEENYLLHFYDARLGGSKRLKQLYSQLPKGMRAQVPHPYGKDVSYLAYETYGAFPNETGAKFVIFAPHAKNVRVILTDEEELQQEYPLERDSQGVWRVELAAIKPGQRYQYRINGKVKIDPYGREQRPSQIQGKSPYSIVVTSSHEWKDAEWMKKRSQEADQSKPMSIFEVWLSIWDKENGKPLNYRQLAPKLARHCKEMSFTHVELMGLLEYPYEASWGYQVTGYFSPNHRLGTVDDFKYFVDYLHQNEIGVILDWVPAHFANDSFGLKSLDGTSLFEATGIWYNLSIRRIFLKYNSQHFDYTKSAVREFLISSAVYWLKEMHVDGLRFDCLQSVLTSENKSSAIDFIKDLNAIVHRECSGAFMHAEDFTGDIRTTHSFPEDGFYFDRKWHVGLIRPILNYFNKPMHLRKYQDIKKIINSDNSHKQIIAISHDEVNKGMAIINASGQCKYSTLRALFSFVLCTPGKKLFFMGDEYGNEIPFFTLIGKEQGIVNHPLKEQQKQLRSMVAALNKIYKEEPAFYERDDNGHDIEWIEDPKKCIHAYRRESNKGDSFVCLHNFVSDCMQPFTITCKNGSPKEVFSSDAAEFGGQERSQIEVQTIDDRTLYTVHIPPLSTVVIQEFKKE